MVLEDGEALVVFRHQEIDYIDDRSLRTADVTFYLPSDRVGEKSTRVWFSSDDRINEQLAVARDAILVGRAEWRRAEAIAREVLPQTHALALGLFRREARTLAAIAATGCG